MPKQSLTKRNMVDLLPALRRIERRFGREVNLTRYSEKEFRDKIRDGDHFLKSVTKDKICDAHRFSG
jgi:hypothetical protein